MTKKIIQRMLILGGITAALLVLAAGGVWTAQSLQDRLPSPVVMIHIPSSGKSLPLGDPLAVQSTSRDEQSDISKVELWVSQGHLLSLIDTATPGEANRTLSVSQGWQPAAPGTYQLIVKATNLKGISGQASVEVQVVDDQTDEHQAPAGQVAAHPAPEISAPTQAEFPGFKGEGGGSDGGEDLAFPPDPEPDAPLPASYLVGMFNMVLQPFVPIELNDVMVEVEALSLIVENAYDELYCFVALKDQAGDRVPTAGSFDVSNQYSWNIPDYLSGENRATVLISEEEDLRVNLECWGTPPGSTQPVLAGMIDQYHPESDWDGELIERQSQDGGGFTVIYKITKAIGPLEAPTNLRTASWGGSTYLMWSWTGSLQDIGGYHIYRNDNLIVHVPADQLNLKIPPSWIVPPCGQEYIYQIYAYKDEVESAPSNTLTFQGELCGGLNDVLSLDSEPICDNGGHSFEVSYRYNSLHGTANLEVQVYQAGEWIQTIQSSRPQITAGEGTVLVPVKYFGELTQNTDQLYVVLSDQNNQPFYVESFEQSITWDPPLPDPTIPSAWVDWEHQKLHIMVKNLSCAGMPAIPPHVIIIPATDDRALDVRAAETVPAGTHLMLHVDLVHPEETAPGIDPQLWDIQSSTWDDEVLLVLNPVDVFDIPDANPDNNKYMIKPTRPLQLRVNKIAVYDDHDRYSHGEWRVNINISRLHEMSWESVSGSEDVWMRYNSPLLHWGEGAHSLGDLSFNPTIEVGDTLVIRIAGFDFDTGKDLWSTDPIGDELGDLRLYHNTEGPIQGLDNLGYSYMGLWEEGGSFSAVSDSGDYKFFYSLITE